VTKQAQDALVLQREVCQKYNSPLVQSDAHDILGFASRTVGLVPMNGLRHPATASTTGWYLWFGEEFSEASDFFEPIHVSHVYEQYPETKALLGLAPGFRFLSAGTHLDVWFDEHLLITKE
jgi:hypothetical protein